MGTFSEIKTIVQFLWRLVCAVMKVIWRCASLITASAVVLYVVLIFIDTSHHFQLSERYDVYKYNIVDRFFVYDKAAKKMSANWLSTVGREYGEDSLVWFSRKDFFGNNERFGYIDVRTGKIAIKPQLYYAGEFSEGLAAVNGKEGVGFIDTTGKMVLPVNGDLMTYGVLATTMNKGTAIVRVERNHYGIISRSGEWALEAKYIKIEHICDGIYIVTNEDYYEGCWSVEKGWILKPIYDEIEANWFNSRVIVTHEGLRREVDFEGNTTKPLLYDSSEQMFYIPAGYDGEGNGIATEYFRFRINNQCGVMNINTKEVVLPAVYEYVDMRSKETFQLTTECQSFLADKHGKVIPIKNN